MNSPTAQRKGSGTKWLGDIPAHWGVVQSRRLFAERNEKARVSDQQLTVSQKYGLMPQQDFMEIEGRRIVQVIKGHEILKHVEAGDFVMSMRSFQGGLEYSTLTGSVSSAYVPLRPLKWVCPAYFRHLFKSSAYIQELQSTSDLVRDGQALRFENFSKVRLPIVPMDEQAAIASYLDRATSRIDDLTTRKNRFIELLREKRQALIAQSVTKGLDAGAPMKDSGVEWLGKVPAEWDVAPLRVFLRLRRDIVGAESKNTKLLSLTLQGVVERDLENPTGKIPASFDSYQRISKGEMVFCLFDIDETPRTVGIASQEGMLTGAYSVFRPQSELWARYLYYFFLHVDDYKRLKPFYKGLRKTIRPGPFLSIQVPRPPESVAAEIVAHLDRATLRIDALIAKTEHSITLLRELRSALIASAVTGKLDARVAR